MIARRRSMRGAGARVLLVPEQDDEGVAVGGLGVVGLFGLVAHQHPLDRAVATLEVDLAGAAAVADLFLADLDLLRVAALVRNGDLVEYHLRAADLELDA